jgi:hypothetical protein
MLIFLVFILTKNGITQQARSDTVDSLSNGVWGNVLRSAILPGWGQIKQEHPGKAVIFYGLNVYFFYNMALNLSRYNETDNPDYKKDYYKYLGLSLQVYALNLIDVFDCQIKRNFEPWPGTLFTDLPVKSPWGAVTRSAMIPGWGQLYNEQYIKSALTFIVVINFARNVYLNNQRYKDTGEAKYRDRRSTNSWYLGLAYALTMIDAFIDASLYKFNDSIELTYQILPKSESLALGVRFVF